MVGEVRLLGIRATVQTFQEATDRILAAANSSNEVFRAHFCTVHSLVEATSSRALADAFETASMVCTDGMPLVWLVRRRGFPKAERCAGPDLMLAVCDRGRAFGLRHYFLGGRPGTPERLAARLSERFPGLTVAGTNSPPFRAVSRQEDDELVGLINDARPHVLWIGLGSPKQDLWAAAHQDRLGVPLVMPVGAAFDYYSGNLRRAPALIRRLGLEWLFRAVMEPRRLWRRYLSTNVRFGWLLLREKIKRRRQSAQR